MEWFYIDTNIEPIDSNRHIDVSTGIVASTVFNSNRGKAKARQSDAYTPNWGNATKKQTWQSMLAGATNYTQQLSALKAAQGKEI